MRAIIPLPQDVGRGEQRDRHGPDASNQNTLSRAWRRLTAACYDPTILP